MLDALPSKVLHVITTIARGGAENHLIDLIAGQMDRDWSVGVAFLKSDGDAYWRTVLEARGVKIFNLDLQRYGQLSPIVRLRRAIREFRPSIVHAHMPPAELYTRLALVGRPQIPLVASKHNDERFMPYGPSAQVERWCARRADRTIAISGAVERFFKNRWPADVSARITRIHYGLDPSPYDQVDGSAVAALRTEWGLAGDVMVIGTVARLTGQKALDVMIRGFAKAVRITTEQPLRLVIVGRGPDEAALRDLCLEQGVGDRVVFAGFRTDIPVVMRAFDLFALTSDYEGFGLVLLEAMSARKPVLATAVSAIPEVVLDDETGVLIPAQDDAAFAGALGRLLDPEVRRAMGEAGRARVEAQFSLDAMTDATLSIYRRVLAG